MDATILSPKGSMGALTNMVIESKFDYVVFGSISRDKNGSMRNFG